MAATLVTNRLKVLGWLLMKPAIRSNVGRLGLYPSLIGLHLLLLFLVLLLRLLLLLLQPCTHAEGSSDEVFLPRNAL